MKLSNFLTLNLRDALNGFVVAFLAAALTALVEYLNKGDLPTGENLKAIAIIGLTAGVSYVVKNLFSNSNGEILKPEPVA
jgi:hypothetical protein